MKKTPEEIIKEIISYVGWLLLFSALSFYLYGITDAIIKTINATKENPALYPPFMSATIGSIQALLLANLGVLLGISVTNPNSNVARSLRLSGSRINLAVSPPSPMELSQKIQLLALIIYILSLIACLVTWITKNFVDDSKLVVQLFQNLVKCLQQLSLHM